MSFSFLLLSTISFFCLFCYSHHSVIDQISHTVNWVIPSLDDLNNIFFLYRRLLLVINFIHISVYTSIPIAQFITPPPHPHRFPPLVAIHLFSTSVSQLLPCKPVHLYHFSSFHIYVLTYDICFSLSDLL